MIIKAKSNTEGVFATDSYSNEKDMDTDELSTSEDNLPSSQKSERIQVAYQMPSHMHYRVGSVLYKK